MGLLLIFSRGDGDGSGYTKGTCRKPFGPSFGNEKVRIAGKPQVFADVDILTDCRFQAVGGFDGHLDDARFREFAGFSAQSGRELSP
jgi:hypothetical protein